MTTKNGDMCWQLEDTRSLKIPTVYQRIRINEVQEALRKMRLGKDGGSDSILIEV